MATTEATGDTKSFAVEKMFESDWWWYGLMYSTRSRGTTTAICNGAGVLTEEYNWAGLFFQVLLSMHQQLCLVNSQLEPSLLVFPEEPFGMCKVLFGGTLEMTKEEIDALRYQLSVYLSKGLDM
ncbi:Junction-mediating and -regulatory protein [Lemmus lemmus]